MSKARYASEDCAEDASGKNSEGCDVAASARRTTNVGKRNNSTGLNYYECANEKLYEAYAELHLLAQGAVIAANEAAQLRVNYLF